MTDWGDTIAWPTRDPGWIGKVVLMSLITIIPIVGQMAMFGWMLAALDNLRAGREELPPAGFGYIGRGVNLFVVYLIYVLVLVVVLGVFFGLAAGIAAAAGSSNNGAVGGVAALFFLLGYLVLFVGLLALYFLLPGIILLTDRGGIGGGLNIVRVIELAQRHATVTLLAGLMTILAYVIGSLGSFLCFVGVFLTMAYGYAMMAGIVRVYEQLTGFGPAAPPSPPAYPPVAPA